jgi:protein kinase C substrate 80K-H
MELSVKKFKFHTSVVTFFAVLTVLCSSEVPRPRGVSLSRASLYSPDRNFLCFDNSKTIAFSQVNDDYCDCPDGSDEPGTSACPNGIFYCANAGHKPLNLASSRVNDGICDCCDGSDEYAKYTVTCPNICLQLGRHAREEAQRKAELIKAGKHLKAELSQRGIQRKEEKKEKLVELQKNKDEAEKVKAEKQKLKDGIEALENKALELYRKLEEEEKKQKAEAEAAKNRVEATETFNKFDSNQDGLIDLSELQTRQTFDKDRNGEVSEEEAKYFLNNEESVDLEKFITDAWPNIKPYLMMDAGLFKPPTTETTPGELEDLQEGEEDEEHDDGATDGEEEEEEEEEEPYQPEEQVDEPSKALQYDEETQKIVDQATSARNEFAEAERAVRDIESEIKSIQEYLEKDFGPDEEFASLEGECFDYSDHEYIYKLCPFEKTTQQPKSGSAETRLGTWGRWDGLEDNKYEFMLYDRGQSCWNGPQRSSKVKVVCGTENKVTSVSEPNRCEYLFEFVTPAACRELSNDDDLHDEL